MKTPKEITELVCVPHCRFYRPGEKEELSCAGYDFFSTRLDQEKITRAARDVAAQARPPQRFDHNPRIEALLCKQCEFRTEDCDFMGGEDIPDAVPCGGYVLLARLLAAGLPEAEEWLNERL